tara:strand:+ start:92 stop:1399 length:1308 start_codon:yes stop_codon:yes gene_type:complete
LLLFKKMIEILNSTYIFFLFVFLTYFPINVYNQKISNKSFNIKSLNLLINLNILLILSLLPYNILNHKILIILIIIITLIFSYKGQKKNFFDKNLFIENFLFLIIFTILSSNILNNLYLEWDAQKFYFIKSSIFFQGGVFSDLKTFEFNHFHPHFGQYIWAFFSKIGFIENEVFGRLFYLLIYCFSLLYLSTKTNFKNCSYLGVFVFLVLLTFEYKFFSGLQEIIIFSLLTIASINLYNIYKKQSSLIDLLQCILIANILIWTKAEGFVYSIIVLILILFSSINYKQKFLTTISILAFIISKYLIYFFSEFNLDPRPDSYSFNYILNLDFMIILSKLKIIILFLIYYLSTNEIMILNLITLGLFYYINYKNLNTLKFIYIFLLLNFLFILVAYIFINLDTEYAVRTTMDRIVFSTSGFYLISVIHFLNLFNKKIK